MPFTKTTPPIYYETKGQGPPIIWSHGLFMDHDMFKTQVEKFSAQYQCISWDERAHGKTASDDCPPFSYYDSAADLMAILDDLKIEKAILAGMSQGGYLSLRAALKYPERVQALILIDTQAKTEADEAVDSHKTALDSSIRDGRLNDELCDYAAAVIMDPHWEGTLEWKEKWKTYKISNVLAAMQCLTSRDDISGEISKIKAPALIIHGTEDKAITMDRAEEMHKSLSNSKMVKIPGQRHAPNMTASDEVNEHIQDFLNTLK